MSNSGASRTCTGPGRGARDSPDMFRHPPSPLSGPRQAFRPRGSRQVLGDAAPVLALVRAGVEFARRRCRNRRRPSPVGRWPAPGGARRKRRSPAAGPRAESRPASCRRPACARRRPGLGHEAALHVAVERHEESVSGSRGCAAAGKPKLDGRPASMLSQSCAAVVAAVHAAMVLLVEPVRLARRHDEAVHALAEFGIALVLGVEVAPACRGCAAPRSCRRRPCRTRRRRRSPTQICFSSSGCETSECRISPPPPGCHSGRDGCSRKPETCCQLSPPSLAAEQPGRLDAGVEACRDRLAEAPHRPDRLLALRIGQALAGMRPGLGRGRSTSTRPGRTTRCRRRRRSSRFRDRR